MHEGVEARREGGVVDLGDRGLVDVDAAGFDGETLAEQIDERVLIDVGHCLLQAMPTKGATGVPEWVLGGGGFARSGSNVGAAERQL